VTKKLRLQNGEVSLSDHCNLRCAGCNHSSPFLSQRCTPCGTILRDLSAIGQHVRFGDLRLTGGEPLLNPDFHAILTGIRSLDVCDTITLVTNGTLLAKIKDEDWDILDCLWISLYPEIRRPWSAGELYRKCKRHGVRLWLNQTPTFRHTFLNRRNDEANLIRRIYRRCRMAHVWQCNLIYEGRFYKCVTAPFMKCRLGRVNIPYDDGGLDSVSLQDGSCFSKTLRDYLASRRPLPACAYCLGTSGRSYLHRQLSLPESELTECHKDVRSCLSLRNSLIGMIFCRVGGSKWLHRIKWSLRYRLTRDR
jgi:hypothetical protein